ncbi:MAG TPA: hypothetical protein VL426_00125 [Candidatus Binatia bacterium]|nr:hypothetical protein [Candidatus Binatia bacterium]
MTDDRRFETVFRENIRRRSRTASGQDKGSETSKSKKPLALQGEALAAKVAANTERLVADVAATADRWAANMPIKTGDALCEACERWFDIVNDGLYGPGAYADEFAALEKDAAKVGPLLELPLSVNRRYRLWTPGYTTIKVPPVLLETFMSAFYDLLGGMLFDAGFVREPDEPADLAQGAAIMAYADLMMDGELHPWMDGCGRVSTALVMAVARSLGLPPPLFAETKDGHYATIRDLMPHTEYFVAAMRRGAEHRP